MSAAQRRAFDTLRDASLHRNWFWLDDGRRWSQYHNLVQRTIDDAFIRGERQVTFRIPSQSHHRTTMTPHYRVSFDTMSQLNLDTSNKRDVIFTFERPGVSKTVESDTGSSLDSDRDRSQQVPDPFA